jgi:hypothetical protein
MAGLSVTRLVLVTSFKIPLFGLSSLWFADQ